jgi:hypothetical protein
VAARRRARARRRGCRRSTQGSVIEGSGWKVTAAGIREQIVHEIQQVFEGRVVWGSDLMRLTISGSRVSTIEPRRE